MSKSNKLQEELEGLREDCEYWRKRATGLDEEITLRMQVADDLSAHIITLIKVIRDLQADA